MNLGTLSALLLWTLLASPQEDRILDQAVTLQTPKKKSRRTGGAEDEVLLRMWIPAGEGPIRGAIVNPFYLKAVGQRHWQAFGRHHRFGIVAANYFGVRKTDFGSTLEEGLRKFAEAADRPEIAGLPLCFVGMSAGAGMSTTFAQELPARVIAVAPVCLEVGPKSEASREIPMLTIFGSKGGRQLEKLEAKLPVARSAGARWGIAPMWGVRHEFSYANNLVMPFFDQVIRRRVGDTGSPLAAFPEDEGWLGGRWNRIDSFGEYAGEKGSACWLPNRAVARVWRAFVHPEPLLKFVQPRPLGGGNPFAVHSAGAPLEVVIGGKGDLDGAVELFDGDVRVGTADAVPYRFSVEGLKPGVHAFWARARTMEGAETFSRPSAVIVEDASDQK